MGSPTISLAKFILIFVGAILNLQMEDGDIKNDMIHSGLASQLVALLGRLQNYCPPCSDAGEVSDTLLQASEWGWRLLDDMLDERMTWTPVHIRALVMWLSRWTDSSKLELDEDQATLDMSIAQSCGSVLLHASKCPSFAAAVATPEAGPALESLLRMVEQSQVPDCWTGLEDDEGHGQDEEARTTISSLTKAAAHALAETTGHADNLNTLCPLQDGLLSPHHPLLAQVLTWLRQESALTSTKVCALLMLGNFAHDDERSMALVTLEGVLPSIIQIWRLGAHDMDVVHAASHCLANLAVPTPNKPRIAYAGVIPCLSAFLQEKHDAFKPVQFGIVSLLKNLTVSLDHPDISLEIMDVQHEGRASLLPPILALWRRTDDQTLRVQVARVLVMLLRSTYAKRADLLSTWAKRYSLSDEELARLVAETRVKLADDTVVSALTHLACHARAHPVLMSEAWLALALLAQDHGTHLRLTPATNVGRSLLVSWPSTDAARVLPRAVEALSFSLDEMPIHVATNAATLWHLVASATPSLRADAPTVARSLA